MAPTSETAVAANEGALTDPGGPDGEKTMDEIRYANAPDDDDEWVEI
ncbi:MAG: hypothetical protein IID33_13050 [Planctomycetes bacterium]|nr:hypothetical protein [Planctomycetota bacterium]